MKRWLYRPFDPAVAARIAVEHSLPELLAALLAQRKVCEPEAVAAFLQPSLDQLYDPFRMKGMAEAVDRLRQAAAQRETVLLYGDYDVDGTTAVTLLGSVLRALGAEPRHHVPHRVREGYGLRIEPIERAAAEGVRLVVSADTGITGDDVVARARELGVDCIITDHHLPNLDRLPRALAVLNPNQSDCPYPEKNLCGVGVAFKLAQALLEREGWPAERRTKFLRSLLKIVAIGTVADLVPLTGENRILVALGLDGLRRPANPGLRALLDVAGLRGGGPLSAGDVGFRVAPRLNAAGRMDTADLGVALFGARDADVAADLAARLDQLNAARQQEEEETVRAICERLAGSPPPDVLPFFVVEGEGWHPGVIGIVASRIVERFHRPTLVLSVNAETGLATGSARSIPGLHLLEALQAAAPLFERFGGHRQAAGCTIRAERVPALREALNDYAAQVLGPEDFQPVLLLDAELPFRRITDELMEQIARLAPHGLGNPTPLFATANVRLCGQPRVLKERHLRLRMQHDNCAMSAIGWRMAELAPSLDGCGDLDAAYCIESDDYWGGWRLNLKDLRTTLLEAAPGGEG